MMNKKGFTLVELMVVIVIIGVLAAVAIPKFSAATNKAKASEMPSVMSQILSAQDVYHAETNGYTSFTASGALAAGATQGTLKANLGVDAQNAKYFNYVGDALTNSNTANDVVTINANLFARIGDADGGNVNKVVLNLVESTKTEAPEVTGSDAENKAALENYLRSYLNSF